MFVLSELVYYKFMKGLWIITKNYSKYLVNADISSIRLPEIDLKKAKKVYYLATLSY